MNLSIGDKIRWESAAGVLRGTIKNIVLSPSAAGKVTPWIDVEFGIKNRSSTRFCGSDSNLKMMRVTPFANK
jgi:hypothetical protein